MYKTLVPRRKIQVVPAFTGAAFSNGDAVGVKFTIPGAGIIGGGGGIIVSAVLVSKIAFVATDLLIFDADFTGVADNAAFALTVADAGKVVGSASFASGVAMGTPSVSQVAALNLSFQSGPSGNLFGQIVTRGTPTYTAGDLTLTLIVQPDRG
jgi:hypothetical protein